MTNEIILSFKGLENRGKYARDSKKLFERNEIELLVGSASVKTAEIFIQPKDYNELIWEKLPYNFKNKCTKQF